MLQKKKTQLFFLAPVVGRTFVLESETFSFTEENRPVCDESDFSALV